MLEPGDQLSVVVDEESKALVISPVNKVKETIVTYTDWGFPVIHAAGEFPEDYNFETATRDGYEEYFNRKFGNL